MRKELNSDHLCTVECCRGLIFIIILPGGEVNPSIMVDSLCMQLRDLGYKIIRSTNTWQPIL